MDPHAPDAPSDLLDHLNPAQRQAVTVPPGPALVLAGAGSGKTRVLTHRIAWLISEQGVSPHSILAVTFTNKAAAEMRARIERMLGFGVRSLWIGTFHGLNHRFLRMHWQEAGLPQTFQILDSDDQQRLIKRVIREASLDDKLWPPKMVQSFINGHKEEGRRAAQIGDARDPRARQLVGLYITYERLCQQGGLVDFAELLLRPVEVLRRDAALRGHYQRRFEHVLVDEFQDTNGIQYEWLKLLAGGQHSLFAVGDEDQCLSETTRVTMADGRRQAIARVRAGEQVLSGHGSGDFRPALVLRTHARKYQGPMVTLRTQSGRRIVSTPDHEHFAGYLLDEAPQIYFTYLMHKEGVGFRVGTSSMHSTVSSRRRPGFRQRSLQEHADALWILRTHAKESESRLDEVTTSLRYGIPTMPFVPRKGLSANGIVHDAVMIRKLFRAVDSVNGAERLLNDLGLDFDRPHHRPQGRDSRRHNVVVTLCGDRRGRSPMHRISVVGNDQVARGSLASLGLSVRSARRGSRSWRFETCRKDFGEVWKIAQRVRRILDGNMVVNARLQTKSLPMVKAAAVRPGMAIFVGGGTYDIVTQVDCRTRNVRVCDIDVENTHNFIADGLVTHNSIYSWRGARVEHILRFEQDMPGAHVVRLEQNYRSTGTILKAANEVIANNESRLGKKLWTDSGDGEPIDLYRAANETDEARHVVERIRAWMSGGGSAADCAILYRSNAQSRVFEELLVRDGISYRVYGGLRFFERAEIRDSLAYLRLATNVQDDGAFDRIVNVPARGIGAKTLEAIRDRARERGISWWEASRELTGRIEGAGLAPALPARSSAPLAAFLDLIEEFGAVLKELDPSEAVSHVIERSGLRDHYLKEKSDRGESRVENLEELVSAVRGFEDEPRDDGMTVLDAFLAHAALEAGEREAGPGQEAVHLMTLHAAKGLEFPLVFLTGLEEGLFPHQGSAESDTKLEEERRLCYVGMTRAMKKLTVSWAESRRIYGSERYTQPSRFLAEMPEEFLREVRPKSRMAWDVTAPAPARPAEQTSAAGGAFPFKLGGRVRHSSFGEGTVVRFEGSGPSARVQVNFAAVGPKWLVIGYARLVAA